MENAVVFKKRNFANIDVKVREILTINALFFKYTKYTTTIYNIKYMYTKGLLYLLVSCKCCYVYQRTTEDAVYNTYTSYLYKDKMFMRLIANHCVVCNSKTTYHRKGSTIHELFLIVQHIFILSISACYYK